MGLDIEEANAGMGLILHGVVFRVVAIAVRVDAGAAMSTVQFRSWLNAAF